MPASPCPPLSTSALAIAPLAFKPVQEREERDLTLPGEDNSEPSTHPCHQWAPPRRSSLLHIVSHLTTLSLQLDKYKRADFGQCPCVLCQTQPLLPVGLTNVPYEKSVELYCGHCEDIYPPKSSQHSSIDGASYFFRKSVFRFLFFDSSLVGGTARVAFLLPLITRAAAWASSMDACDC